MPYRLWWNDVQREGVKPSPDLASQPLCKVALHNILVWHQLLPFMKVRQDAFIFTTRHIDTSSPAQSSLALLHSGQTRRRSLR